LVKIEDYETSVGHCYRCKTVVEPYLSDQWFIKIKPLAEAAIKVVEEGHIKFIPDRWTKVYLQWMTNLKDWCISRQLWWGHRIPVWYCDCGEVIVSEEEPTKCPKCSSSKLNQDPDVFDTWFSSALWPFSTLGWPEQTKDIKTYYPTSVLVTGYDIITFWVSRMIMTGVHFMGKPPFHTVFIHGLIRDITGKKMSKSLGNVIDPLEVINHAGADALRFALISLVTGGGQDIKLAEEKITEARNFANKIWNVSRFAMMTCGEGVASTINSGELADKWILSRYNRVVLQITEYLDNFQMGEAAKLLYEFIWSEFCDWYIEIAKIRLYGGDEEAKKDVAAVLTHVLEGILKLLHPFMPFETEEIYQILKGAKTLSPKDSIMVKPWPQAEEKLLDDKPEKEMEGLIELIRSIRNLRSTMNIAPGQQIKIFVEKSIGGKKENYIKTLAKVSAFEQSEKFPPHTAASEAGGFRFGLPLEGLIDFKKESERLRKEYDKLKAEAGKVTARLNDENFKKNATEGSAQKEQQKLEEYSARIKTLEGYLLALAA
jgi:valyl-tRNA synthetase